MTATDDDSNLEILLAKAANPLNKDLDMEAVSAFHECMSEEPEGPQTALRFLAHRIQSPQEKEAMMALLVLEECVRKSDPRFLNEIGKFRFLNELIKVVSPKYLGNRAPSKVKQKILELMFKWSVELKHESKINEAYQMLRKQGVISEDPVHVLEHYEPPEAPSPRPQNPIFEDEEKSKLLQTLLQSKDPDDLQAANRLIKSMVKEADRRMELMARTMTELEAVHNNAVVLSDMLDHYLPGKTSEEEKDLMKELFESCERLRPKLFRLAGEMDEKDSGLDDILRANDELTVVITKYRKVMGMEDGVVFDLSAHSKAPAAASAMTYEASLMDLGSPVATTTSGSSSNKSKTEVSFLDDQLLSLGLNDAPDIQPNNSSFGLIPNTTEGSETGNLFSELDTIFSAATATTHVKNPIPPMIGIGNAVLQPTNAKSEVKLPTADSQNSKPKFVSGLDELDVIGQSLLKQSLPQNITKMEFPSTPQKVPMSQLQSRPSTAAPTPVPALQSQSSLLTSLSDTTVFTSSNTASPSRGNDPFSLAEIFVPLETIQPGILPPLTLRDKDGLTVVVHFGKDSPRDDVTVMVVSTMNKNTKAQFKNVKFQAAVPKSMKIKLQPPSATDLPPYNPILPAAITQVMLLANPNKDKVRLKYKITYTMNDENKTDIGEVDSLLSAR